MTNEKKVIAPLLGKLYVSPASSEDKIRTLYEDVSAAVEENLLSDATGRNALYKIHVSLGKIVNSLNDGDKISRRSRSASVATSAAGTSGDRSMAGTDDGEEDATVVHLGRKDGDATVLQGVAEEDEDEGGGDDGDDTVKMEPDTSGNTVIKRDGEDELVEEFLSDDEDA
ncbi:hypothetical protein RRF57_011713 [Xylaria bambusicola]|uniref:Uncharacterized protein n=1 Tax=Xylaria bambusicola TaxID=326684 RepID=A0AAN7V0X7_9PEZI